MKYINVSGYVLQFNLDSCIVVPEASPLGMVVVFLDGGIGRLRLPYFWYGPGTRVHCTLPSHQRLGLVVRRSDSMDGVRLMSWLSYVVPYSLHSLLGFSSRSLLPYDWSSRSEVFEILVFMLRLVVHCWRQRGLMDPECGTPAMVREIHRQVIVPPCAVGSTHVDLRSRCQKPPLS